LSLNPYAVALGEYDPVEVIASTPQKMAAVLGGLSEEQIERKLSPNKWSVREVLAHLADCEIAFGYRLRQAAAGVELIQPFDQDDWARNYGAYSFPAALATYRAVRAWNLAFIQSLTDEQKTRVVLHPERGEMTVWTIVETMAGHDRHHLVGLEKLEDQLAG
jgi:uncharacterized damage-inducible protein DinB